MTDFDFSLQEVLKHEGLYSNNPSDFGGETVYGIARKRHPSWSGWKIVDALKKATGFPNSLKTSHEIQKKVRDFYKANFWNKLRLDEVEHQSLCFELFDTAINQGSGAAGKYFQKSLNYLNRNGKDYGDIVVDGAVGGKTIAAYKAFMKTASKGGRSMKKNISVILKCINGFQFSKYQRIVEKNPSQEIFFYGWISTRVD